MKYSLVYTRRALKDIQSLDIKVKRRIAKALLRYAENPLDYAQKLLDEKLGSYRFRIGDYRAVFDIEDDELIILRVGHRKEIYRRK